MTKNKDNLGETNYAERRGRNGHLQVLGTFSSPAFGGELGRGRNRIACANACPKPFVHFVATNYYCVIAVSPQKRRCLARSAMLPIQRSIRTRTALPVVHTIKASGFGLLPLGVDGKYYSRTSYIHIQICEVTTPAGRCTDARYTLYSVITCAQPSS